MAREFSLDISTLFEAFQQSHEGIIRVNSNLVIKLNDAVAIFTSSKILWCYFCERETVTTETIVISRSWYHPFLLLIDKMVSLIEQHYEWQGKSFILDISTLNRVFFNRSTKALEVPTWLSNWMMRWQISFQVRMGARVRKAYLKWNLPSHHSVW